MNKLSKMDAGIIIVVLTALSYGITYIVQRGYISYYKLPIMFVDLSINTITPILLSVFILFLMLYFIWKFIIFTFLLFKIIPLEFIKMLRLILDFKYLKDIKKAFVFILPISLIIFTFWFLVEWIYDYGHYDASVKDEYLVIKQKDGLYVEVSSFKDSIIIAPLNLEKESITPKFKAIEMKELKDAEMVHFENGLKVENIKNSKDLTE